ncbi:acyl-CoA dehydrogenase [Alcaligenaceae bacterium SJ-26]|nr:acyl-CoA dehydrogenase [Alcaligenaceae bacterium SJ-26]
MNYKAPLDDIHFILHELAGLDAICALPESAGLGVDLVHAILDENARFVQDAVAPLNRIGDTRPPVWQDGRVTASPGFVDAFRQFAAGGWQGLQHPEQWGGQGLPKLVGAPAIENLNAASLAFSLCPLLTDGVIEALLQVGSEDLQQRFVPGLIDGSYTGTMNLTEPQAGSDLALVATRAVPQQDDTYRLYGQKIFITYGEHDLAENIVHLVLARTPDAPAGIKGISLFVVPKYIEQDGRQVRNDVWCASLEHKLGIHGSPTAVLLYGSGKGEVGEGAVGYRVGELNRGLEYMFIMMNAARYAVGLQGIALAERATQQALAYAHERIQSRAVEGSDGPVAIIHHPDVARLLQTMRALTQAARATAYVAAAMHDQAHRNPDSTQRDASRALYEYLVPVVKGFSTEMAVEVASLGIQVHGGMGYMEETGAAQHLRDARILPIYEGTTAIQANDLLGRKTLRDGGKVVQKIVADMQATAVELARLCEAESDKALAGSLALMQARFAEAITAYADSAKILLTKAGGDIRGVFAGSVPHLMQAGVVFGGWQMVRSALVCLRRRTAGEAGMFEQDKLDVALFYAGHILPRARDYASQIEAGLTIPVTLRQS